MFHLDKMAYGEERQDQSMDSSSEGSVDSIPEPDRPLDSQVDAWIYDLDELLQRIPVEIVHFMFELYEVGIERVPFQERVPLIFAILREDTDEYDTVKAWYKTFSQFQ